MAHWIFLFLIVFSLVGLPSDDWGEIEELSVVSSNATTKTIRNYWDEHFYGSISGIVSGGQNHSRMASQIEVGFSDHWQNIKFVIEGSYQKNTLKTKYDLVTESPPSAKTSVELDEIIRYESLQFEQAYIEFYPIKPLTLSYGQQTIVWGQLDIFSPVDFLLPTDFNPVGFSFSKADNRLAQMTLKLSYYLTRELEFTSYYFPYFVENNLFQTLDLSDNYQIIDGVKYNTQKIVPKGNDQDSYAFRAAYYRPEYTVAFTYYRGFNHLVPIFREKYLSSSSNDLDYVNEYGFYSKQAF
ncbi:MAG: hypothetical protein VW397_05005, partial [Candidatus Margulisiibacteriota bacterium]